MSKFASYRPLDNLNNPSSVINTINANFVDVGTALDNTLSRDGTAPNEMESDLDMNSNRILNLPQPQDDTEPVRLGDLEDLANGTFQVGDLLDVDLTEPLVDNDFLRFDAASNKWVNEQVTGSGSAPDTADYLVKTANGSLSAERVVTDNTSVSWDWSTSGQAKALRAALTGDVTASSNSNATTIANDVVTFAKMQNVATNSLLGRDTAGTGDVENILLDDTLSMDGSGNLQRAALTGDVTSSAGSNTTTIPSGTVTLAQMANVATSRVIGRSTAGTGVPEALTGAQVGSLITLNDLSDVTITGAASGDIPQYNGSAWVNTAVGSFGAPSAADYLVKTSNGSLSAERVVGDSTSIIADWATPGTVTFTSAAKTGDVTASANGNAMTIANDAVTFAKMQNVATDSLLGRDTASSGDVENILLNATLSMDGSGNLQRAALTGDVTATAGSNATTIANDAVTYAKMQNISAADRLLGRGNGGGSGDTQEISLGTGLSLSGTTLNASGASSGGTGIFPVTFVIACSDETTAITAASNKVKFRMPHAMTVTAVRASLSTAQSTDGAGGIFTIDINESLSTILSTKLTIDNTETTSTTALTAAVISDAALADDALITIDVDQVGDGTAKGLKVAIIGTRTV